MLSTITSEAREWEGYPQAKVICVGDREQLTPLVKISTSLSLTRSFRHSD